MSLVPYSPSGRFVAEWLTDPAEIARAVGGTDFVPVGMRDNLAAITAALLYGDEVGLGPMQSLSKIAVINGRPTLAAEAQRALILQAGHELWIEESTTTRCTVAGRRKGSEQTSRITWTLDDAKRAGIGGKQTWRAYPRQMLLARASAELARAVFADAIGGLAATEEAELDAELAPETNGPTPPSTTRRRQRASVSTPQTSTVTQPPTGARPPLPGDELPPIADAATDEAATVDDGLAGTTPIPPGDAPVAAPMMTDPQRKRLMALFRERGYSGREHRLAWATVHVGRHITSSNELTEAEASHLITLLETPPTSELDEL